MQPTSTICACATAPGGALGIIRVSGPDAIAITDLLFSAHNGRPLAQTPAGRVVYGVLHQAGDSNDVIDDVLVSLFRAPHSYTGDDTTEISCHGSPYIIQTILQALCSKGCRLAEPGEYTRRAFMAGKMDLTQAEAVASLIAARHAAAHRVALNQLRGAVTTEMHTLREQMLHLNTLLELELDFSDHEDLEFASRDDLRQLAQRACERIAHLAATFRIGQAIKRGVPVALIGETNAGKSTILNALVGEERAIVSDIHGTTRDTIECTAVIADITCRFIDTAGLRQTTDAIERIGQDRARQRAAQADLIVWVIDATAVGNAAALVPEISSLCHDGATLIAVINKTDLLSADAAISSPDHLVTTLSPHLPAGTPILAISAHTAEGIGRLRDALAAHLPHPTDEAVIITEARHHDSLVHAHDALQRMLQALDAGLPADLVSEDLRDAIHHLSSVTGEITTDATLHRIFSGFCIGK